MDLGLLSTDIEGARAAALKIFGLFTLFILVGTTLGLKWAALSFAVVGPIWLLAGFRRFTFALVCALFVFAFVLVVLDNVLFVIYPTPFIWEWLASNVF